LKILYVHHVGDALGGSSNSIYQLICSFPEGSINPIVLCPQGKVFDLFQRTKIQAYPLKSISWLMTLHGLSHMRMTLVYYILRTIWAARHLDIVVRTIENIKPDIVHLNDIGLFWLTRRIKRLGIPVVVHARCVMSANPRWFKTIFLKEINRYADFVIAIDESVHKQICEIKRCRVIYNPVDFSSLTQKSKPIHRNDNQICVTYLSGLLEFKGIWDLFDAAQYLKNRQDIVFQIAGTNSRPPEFFSSPIGKLTQSIGVVQDVQKELKRKIIQNNLSDRFILLGHVNNPFDLLLNKTDILVFPSHLNGVGRSVFEAGVFGIPGIVCLHDRVEDIVVHENTGLIVPERNPVELAKAIEYLADNRELRLAMGENAKTKYIKQFDPIDKAAEVLSIYRELMTRNHAT